MLVVLLLSLFSAASAAPLTTPSTCKTVQRGNLSPSGLKGSFGLFRNILAFDPINVASSFGVSLETCTTGPTVPGATSAGTLHAPTSGCFTVKNATTTQGPTVVSAACPTGGAQSDTTWAVHKGSVFWVGPTSAECSSGLYGYKAVNAGGDPPAVQKAPVTLGCSTDSDVFGFSVL